MLPSLGNEGSSSVSIGKRVTSGHFHLNSLEVLQRAGDEGSSVLCPGPMLFLGGAGMGTGLSPGQQHIHTLAAALRHRLVRHVIKMERREV